MYESLECPFNKTYGHLIAFMQNRQAYSNKIKNTISLICQISRFIDWLFWALKHICNISAIERQI